MPSGPALPANRFRLRAGFFTAFVFGYALLALVGTGCEFETRADFGGGEDGLSDFQEFVLDKLFYGTESEEEFWVAVGATNVLWEMTFGVPLYCPPAHVESTAFISSSNPDDDPSAITNTLRQKRDDKDIAETIMRMENTGRMENSRGAYVGFTTSKGMRIEEGDKLAFSTTAEGGPIRRRGALVGGSTQVLATTRAFLPMLRRLGPMAAWRTWRNMERMAAEGRGGMLVPFERSVGAKKEHLFTLRFGVPLHVRDGSKLTFRGMFAGAARGETLPAKILLFVTLRDAAGKKVDSLRVVLKVKGTTIKKRTVNIGEWDIEEDYTMKLEMKTKKDVIEVSDAPMIDIEFQEGAGARALPAELQERARQRHAEAQRLLRELQQ